ncbi:UDP-N-acetylmuramate dehydrogenase [Streptobacillus moniliformis]|uniref:UDP-N-acetylenolpyruvoylglucosamine reductase n=1 Tax=Streptobacillus moniliformis (strain ATCC 14647 / DSM 12112 / NCTC 10651 / 9901) TaxID=519441 RepID=D1AWB0_STRM9|nr:UDP-N-acetylmuramate dehydrogenase [Streptobacillus moniliformis]ACZ00586.1 UDP-N-acetylenolpyruvoylglucosamine reductase [Streptobacillus moniliformis DSM 12112]AVL43002.1 UDP-N-acetylenolpyruvoylglucosamine reductase [Streptobacillus moniliformis]SQA14293.1 UDP-N-acetylenolpyruvoylglucosamine reductase [Streptobacillus moniliformis]
MRILKDVSIKEYSNMKVGGTAKELIFIHDKNELKEIYDSRDRIYLIGNGTNTLISDGYLDISFVTLNEMNDIVIEEKNEDYALVRVYSGVDFNDFIKFMKLNDLSGIENMSGIPGSFGGITNMNAGAYGTEIFDVIEEVEVFDKENGIKVLKKKKMDFRYRGTEIKDNKWVVISTLLKLTYGFDEEASEDKYNQRKTKHPLNYPNLGSTFKNPVGNFAAQLISDCGLKEFRVGDAQVSPIHPNFITNLGNAKFSDIQEIIKHVKKVVNDKTGIMLETEIITVE